MINHIHARLQGLTRGPVGPVKAVLGVVAIAAGMRVLRRYVDNEIEELAELGSRALQLQKTLQTELNRRAAAELDDQGVAYPADVDLDPVERASQIQDEPPMFGAPRFMADQR